VGSAFCVACAGRHGVTSRPAFYALAPGGWRDYLTLLHPPYTLWHLSYVVIGAALAPDWRPARLGLALAAFFLGLGVGAHALDELNGRPLGTRIPSPVLVALATASLAGGTAIGVGAAVAYDLALLGFVAVGAFLAVAYNLELLGGRLHGDLTFAVAWGALPLVAGYFNASGTIRAETLVAGLFAGLLSFAQRTLSTQVRTVRRRAAAVAGTIELRDGTVEEIRPETLLAPPEAALRALAAAAVALAVALAVLRAS
jgi:hypothetical protein